MSAKTGFPCGILSVLLLIGMVHAEDPALSPYAPAATDAARGDAPQNPTAQTYGPSSWITYVKPCCCGPIGGHGPIRTELYVRDGVAVPIDANGSVLGKVLSPGYMIQGGGRSMFFNADADRAWTIDLSLANIHQDHDRADITFPFLGNPNNPVAVRKLNRTFVTLGVGRERWLIAPDDEGWALRVGGDLGGRWGSARLDLFDPTQFSDYRRENDVLTGVYASIHADVEIPWGACILVSGFRAEWGYTFLDLIHNPGGNSDLQDVNLLLTFGARF